MSNWEKIIDKFEGTNFHIKHKINFFAHNRISIVLEFYVGEDLIRFRGDGLTVAAALAALDADIAAGTLTVAQAAERDGVHRNTVLRRLQDGRLRGFKGIGQKGRSRWFVFP